jgi:hypothetical protein
MTVVAVIITPAALPTVVVLAAAILVAIAGTSCSSINACSCSQLDVIAAAVTAVQVMKVLVMLPFSRCAAAHKQDERSQSLACHDQLA